MTLSSLKQGEIYTGLTSYIHLVNRELSLDLIVTHTSRSFELTDPLILIAQTRTRFLSSLVRFQGGIPYPSHTGYMQSESYIA